MVEDLLPERPPPEHLFHYTDAAGLKGILSGRSVWASKVQYMNDAEEFKHAIQVARGILNQRDRDTDSEQLSTICDELSDALERIENVNICAFCLSEKKDLLSQWRAYCPPAGGFSLGFDSNDLARTVRSQDFHLAPCIYNTREQRSLLRPVIDQAIKLFRRELLANDESVEEARERILPPFFSTFSRVAPVIKHRAFAEEREWRLISGLIRNDDPNMNYRPSRSMLIPYYNLDLTDSGDRPFPTGPIVIGPTSHVELSMSSVTGLLANEDVPWHSVSRSQVPYRIL